MGGFLTLVTVALYFVINYFISKSFQDAAIEKGYNNEKYFWFCFFFNMAGYLLVVALPDRKGGNVSGAASKKASLNELPEL